MAHLWIRNADGWGAEKLKGAELDLAAVAISQPPQAEHGPGTRGPGKLVCVSVGGSRLWALIAPAGSRVRVNSRAIPAGICVLGDRDEIRNGSEVAYFSTETLAAIEPFPGAERAVFCGRCRQVIEIGSPAVCCPSCNIWYHQSTDLPCFTYSETCTFCGRATALDAGFVWAPEED